jgi:HEAT repeat protein
MMTLLLAALVALQEAAPTDKEGEAAAHKLREEAAKASIEGKIAAIQEAIKTEHERVIKVIGEMLVTEADPVRIAGAKALATADHPASADVLVAAIAPNLQRDEVIPAIFKAIGDLGWQSAVKTLNDLLPKVGEPEIRTILPPAITALGQLGSLSSVEPLTELLMKLENGARRNPWPNEGAMRRNAEEALRQITGQSFNKVTAWDPWWRDNKDALQAKLIRVYWLKKTQDRLEVAPGDKTPADSILAAARLHPASPAANSTAKKKKKNK